MKAEAVSRVPAGREVPSKEAAPWPRGGRRRGAEGAGRAAAGIAEALQQTLLPPGNIYDELYSDPC